jgi:coproporphyrinogen III oxidase-like Fe-S oxidoreductase
MITKAITLFAKWRFKRALDFTNAECDKAPLPTKEKSYLLYLHIPFCKTLCPYCSFNRFLFEEKTAREYFRLLRKEIEAKKSEGFNFSALYIGGGTTTLLLDELASTIDLCKSLYDIKEVSIEADPNITEETLYFLKNRVDRVSIGVQSFDDDILKSVKRYKKFGSAKEQFSKVELAIKNFKIVNVDMIFNIPTQKLDMIKKDIAKLIELNPTEISYYPLMHSPSVKKALEQSLGSTKNSHEKEHYETITNGLSQKYEQISGWAFAKKGVQVFDEYVVDFEEYVGLGSGAFSFIEDTLYINHFSLKNYKHSIETKSHAIQRCKTYTKKERHLYRVMLDIFSLAPDKTTKLKAYERLLLRGLRVLDRDSQVTPFGRFVSMLLLKEFYIGMDYVREKSREGLKKEDKTL